MSNCLNRRFSAANSALRCNCPRRIKRSFSRLTFFCSNFIRKVHSENFVPPSPRVLICVPCTATEVEKRAIKESAFSAGAREVFLIEEPMAAAIGAGLPVEEAVGSMVVDIGGGTTEIAILSLNGVVFSDSVRIGGDRFDESICNYVRRKYGSVIGDGTAERIKMEIGTAYLSKEVREIEVRGRNLAEGVPKSFVLSSDEILQSLQEPLSGIVQAVKRVLEQSPPELASDIAETGIVLTSTIDGYIMVNWIRRNTYHLGYQNALHQQFCCIE